MRKNTIFITQAAMIAALYVALTFLANMLGLASGTIQIRFSEMLCVLPFFTFAAVPGATIGCLLSNILTGLPVYDVIFGTLATFIGVILAHLMRKNKWLVPVPTVLSNALILPLVFKYFYQLEETVPFLMVTIGLGEFISCYLLGLVLIFALYKHKTKIFRTV